jgi:hypothetical protein
MGLKKTYIKRFFAIATMFVLLLVTSCSPIRDNGQKSKSWGKQRSAYASKKNSRRMFKGRGFGTPSDKQLSKAHKKMRFNNRKFSKSKYKLKKRKGKGRGM